MSRTVSAVAVGLVFGFFLTASGLGDYDTIHEVTERAFERWTSADCRGAAPAIRAQDLGPATCAEPEYNSTAPNANVILFRDQDWPYDDGEVTVAQTLLTELLGRPVGIQCEQGEPARCCFSVART